MDIIAAYVNSLHGAFLNNGNKNFNTTKMSNHLSWWERKEKELGNIYYRNLDLRILSYIMYIRCCLKRALRLRGVIQVGSELE